MPGKQGWKRVLHLNLQAKLLVSFVGVLLVGLLLDHFYARAEVTRHLMARMHGQHGALLNSMHRSILRATVIGLVIATFLAALLARQISHPIREMGEFAARLARGDYRRRIREAGDDEIASLGRALNTLADSLDRAETLRRNLAADVAHELRTPLAGLRGYAEAVRDGVLPPTAENLDAIAAEAVRLGRLVQDLEDLTRLDADQFELHRRPTDLAVLIQGALRVREQDIRTKEIRLEAVLPGDLPPVDADPDRINQVLHNLLANAINHTPRGGRITVRLARDSASQRVSVANSGPGIDPADLPFIFERFYRGDRSRSRATGGSGLGLTIARKLVEAHGGSISAESRPGEGTSFTFTVPRVP